MCTKYFSVPQGMYSNIYISQWALAIGVLAVLVSTGLGPEAAPIAKNADNFCAQVRYLVRVAFATLQRKWSVASLVQKNTNWMVASHFPFKADLSPNGTPGSLLRASRMLLGSFVECLGQYSHQILAKVQFLQNEHVLNSQECYCFRNKSPAGCGKT